MRRDPRRDVIVIHDDEPEQEENPNFTHQKEQDKLNLIIGETGIYPCRVTNLMNVPGDDDNLDDSIREIQDCEEWINRCCAHTRNIVKHRTSYGLKHKVEENIGRYVSNGAFIRAAVNLGYSYERTEHYSPNAYFNMALVAPWDEREDQ